MGEHYNADVGTPRVRITGVRGGAWRNVRHPPGSSKYTRKGQGAVLLDLLSRGRRKVVQKVHSLPPREAKPG